MKTIITLIIISFAGLQGLLETPSINESSQPIEIIFGRGYLCTGKGICNIIPVDSSTLSSIQLISDPEGKPLYIEVPKNRLTVEEAVYQFSDDFIQLDKNFSLSQSRSIEPDGNEIQSGRYPIRVDKFSYRISISSR